jgi:hypothetical protein
MKGEVNLFARLLRILKAHGFLMATATGISE